MKLKYQRWPIHMMPLMMCNQRNANTHQSCEVKNMAFPLWPASGADDANYVVHDEGQYESQEDGLAQRVQWIFHDGPLRL